MLKVMVFIKRLPGTTPKQFRDYYENHHVKLVDNIRHCIVDYRRSYPVRENSNISAIFRRPEIAEQDQGIPDYDCITEVWLEDESALNEMCRVNQLPEVSAAIRNDEDNFLDKSSLKVLVCEEERTKI